MAMERPGAGATRLGKYELLKEQAGGGAASIWVARLDTKLVSVVRVHRHVVKKTDLVESFLTEATRAQSLKSPHLQQVLDLGVNDGEVFAVVDYTDSETLAALITQSGGAGVSRPVALRVARDLLEGLSAAHALAEPMVHGELTPHQVRAGLDGTVTVTGFGLAAPLARMGTQGSRNADRLAYAAPERVKAMAASGSTATPTDPTADVFSAGVIVWELLAKQRLFASKIEAAIVQKVLTAPIAALASVPGADVEIGLSEAVAHALERAPDQRAESVAELIAAIDACGVTLATPAEVGAWVDKLAAKTITARRQELEGDPALIRRSEAPPPPSAGGTVRIVNRKATLQGIPPGPGTKLEKPSAPPEPPAKADPKRPAHISLLDDAWLTTVDTKDNPVDPAVSEAAATSAGGPPKPPPPPPPPRRTAATMVGIIPFSTDAATAALTLEDDDTIDATVPMKAAAPLTLTERLKLVDKPPPSKRPNQTLMLGSMGTAGAKDDATVPLTIPTPAPTSADKPVAHAPPPPKAETPAPARVEARPSTTPAGVSRGPAASALDEVQPGTTLGRYEILMPIARGGMASVWAGRMEGTRGFSRIVAIKTMLPDISDDPDFQSMFLDEARVAARIKHPNVVQILDLGEEADVLYIVMDWVEGETLGTLQKAAKPLGGIPLPIALRIAQQTLAGLHAAHELRDDAGNMLDVVHRDMSPGNVLVSTQGFVKIVDFGIAKSKGRMHVTRAGGLVKGKTPYLSPEQLGQLPIDRRSDIFSFGCLLYVLTTGLHPFRGETEVKTVENIALKSPMSPRELNPNIPVELDKIILRTLEKDPSKRFATAVELQKAIASVSQTFDATTDSDVGEFVLKAIGDAQEARSRDLKAAIAAIEERSRPAPASEVTAPLPVFAAPPPPPADLEKLVDDAVALAQSEEPAAPDLEGLVGASPVHDATPDDDAEAAPPRPTKLKYVVGGVLGLCALIGVIAALTSGGSPTKTSTSASAPVASAPAASAAPPEPAASAPPPAPEPTASAQATAEPSATAEPPKEDKPPKEEKSKPSTSKPRGPTVSRPAVNRPPRPPKRYNPTGI